MMNKFLGVALLGAALGLTACGGDSDSSGSTAVVPANPTPTNPTPTNPTPTNPTTTTCQTSGTDITVPNNGSCTFSLPKYNSGAISTATCSNSRVTVGSITAGNGITLNDFTVKCAK